MKIFFGSSGRYIRSGALTGILFLSLANNPRSSAKDVWYFISKISFSSLSSSKLA